MYNLVIPKDIGSKIAKFPASDQRKIYKYLKLLEQNPFPIGKNIKKLKGEKYTIWRIRTGDLRILYFVEKLTIKILDADYRSRVYR